MRACPVTQGVAPYGRLPLGDELSLLRRSRDGLQPSCASNRVVASSQREGIHVTKTKSVYMAPGAQLSRGCVKMQILTRTQRCVRMVKMQGAEDEGAGSVLKYMTKPEDDSNAADWLL